MIRAMYSGITGLKANQTKLDVIGNNIANVGTTAFKTQRIRFQDMLSQNMLEATGPSTTLGGTNPSQVGLGTQVAGIDTVTTQGNMQPTSRNLDFAVDGSGYFMVGKGKTGGEGIALETESHTIAAGEAGEEGNDFQTFFTRDGSFTLDEYGQLINSDGMRVMGYAIEGSDINYENNKPKIGEAKNVNDEEPVTATEDKLVPLAIPDEIGEGEDAKKVRRFTVEKNGLIKVTLTDNTVRAIGQIAMASFKNTAGLSKEGKNLYSVSANSGEAVFRSGVGTEENNNELGYGSIVQGMLEMSNVDLAEQFTEMIVASRAFQANGKIITTSDEILQDLVNLKR